MNPNAPINTSSSALRPPEEVSSPVHKLVGDREVRVVPGDPALPEHVAIIMDGNGRWAQNQGRKRIAGHEAGAESVRKITTECSRLGLRQLTLYAFSQENWKRPIHEVAFLMRLLKRFVVQERKTIMENNIRFTAIGRLERLPRSLRRHLRQTTEMSAGHTGLNLCLALSYGGRAEIVDGVRAIAEKVASGQLKPQDIDESLFAQHLYQPGPDPDLLVRTAGEMRVSNFLLWQLSYSELYVARTCWPEFHEPELHRALDAYMKRRRTFGGLEAVPVADGS